MKDFLIDKCWKENDNAFSIKSESKFEKLAYILVRLNCFHTEAVMLYFCDRHNLQLN